MMRKGGAIKSVSYSHKKMSQQSVPPTVASKHSSSSAPTYEDDSEASTSEDEESLGSLAEFVTGDSSEEEDSAAASAAPVKRRRIQAPPSDDSDSESYASDEVPSDVEPPRAPTKAGKYTVRARPLAPVERYWDARNHAAAMKRERFGPYADAKPAARRPRTMGDDMRARAAADEARIRAASQRAPPEEEKPAPKRKKPYACDVYAGGAGEAAGSPRREARESYTSAPESRATY